MRPAAPCMLLRLRQVAILIDCGLELSRLVRPAFAHHSQLPSEPLGVEYIPNPLLVDMAEIDAILVSNHKTMTALPFLTERTSFKGKVYATDATVLFGRLYMEELIFYVEKHRNATNTFAKNAHALPSALVPLAQSKSAWQASLAKPKSSVSPELFSLPPEFAEFYTTEELESCISKVQSLSFNQKVNLFNICTVIPTSSGYAIGSANWVIDTGVEKIFYMSSSALPSTKGHSQPFDPSPLPGVNWSLPLAGEIPEQTPLPRSIMESKKCDLLVVNDLAPWPTGPISDMVSQICSKIVFTLQRGGNVLLPCSLSGHIFDLIESVHASLSTANVGRVPIYLVSPEAKSSLSYANIMSEWLTSSRQEQVYVPETPFMHGNLIDSRQLQPLNTIVASTRHWIPLSQPVQIPQRSVVFCGHPSLRLGDSVHFLKLWGRDPRNALILTDPDYQVASTLLPFQPLAMDVAYFPLDARLSTESVRSILSPAENALREPPARSIVFTLPKADDEDYGSRQAEAQLRLLASDVQMTASAPPSMHRVDVFTCAHHEALDLTLEQPFQNAFISSELARRIFPNAVSHSARVAPVHGIIESRDHVYTLRLSEADASSPFDVSGMKLGKVQAERVVQRLIETGFEDLTIRQSTKQLPDGSLRECTIISVNEYNASLVVWSHGKVNIFTSGSSGGASRSMSAAARSRLKAVVLSCV